ncbi:hypothetical protein ACSU6B_23260 [Neobacillus sp. C211]|uniref:hypothetical protein n=1 Tax=unclassified Neobacillus TaxID=2675272 RepID=UPI00397C78D4
MVKVIVYDNENIIINIFNDVYDPQIDRDRGVISHANGKVYGLKDKDFIIVEDHVPVTLHSFMNDDLKDYDRSHKYDGFTFEDVKEVIQEGIKEIKNILKDKDK